jgi:hypothetical protein
VESATPVSVPRTSSSAPSPICMKPWCPPSCATAPPARTGHRHHGPQSLRACQRLPLVGA